MEASETERAPRALLVLGWLAAVLVLLALVLPVVPVLRAAGPDRVVLEPVLLLLLLLALVRRLAGARPLLVVGAVVCWLTALAAAGDWLAPILLLAQGPLAGTGIAIVPLSPDGAWVRAAVGLLAAVAATVLAAGTRRPRPDAPATADGGGPEPPDTSSSAGAELERRPTWEPDEATGAVWRRATDAARGDQPDRDWGPSAAANSTDRDQAREDPTRPG
ncbi:hypothetical protein [Desertihabitans aurantiacus]|uniref:hypothetical protein n=1 Tax=Desertihabitans aurantiacus TaxID=2282477 RepID=UPI000DF7FBED|nr:hypothetical protein [Desertihabitans aurantiacus]